MNLIMRSISSVVLLLIAFGSIGGEVPVAVDSGRGLVQEEVERLKLEGANGDAESAFEVSLHYSSGGNARSGPASEWRAIAAENGHSIAQYNIWFLSRESGDPVARARGVYWLRKSADAGYRNAIDALEQLEDGP